jgi:beta-fructofuranosidase
MNYRPDAGKLLLWDTWMFVEPEGQRMHLFFLANEPGKDWQWVGHAVSEDLVHWEELPAIALKRPDDTYDVGTCLGTGMVFASPNGGFMMSYTANLSGPVQKIAFLHSTDLIHWDKKWQEPCIQAIPPYYETDGTKCVCKDPAFRDAYVHRVGNHYEALIGAHAASGPTLLRGCIARYQSTDSELRRWEAMPPIIGPGVSTLMEVPEHFQIGSKHYLNWSTGYWFGTACDTRSRRQCFGSFYAMSDSYEGPYRVPDDNLLIGSSQAVNSYVGRTIEWQGRRILYHHMWWPSPSFALPKQLIQETDGTLKTVYWPGIEKIHTGEIALPLEQIAVQGENLHEGTWKSSGSTSLTGSIDKGGSLGLVPVDLDDVHLRCTVTAESGTRFGVTLRDPGHAKYRKEGVSKEIKGVALQGDLRYGQWHFGTPEHSWASRIDPNEVIMDAPAIGKTYQLDLIVRDIYFEAYIDGVWKFTRVIKDKARRGRIGFFVEDGAARFENIRAWALEPMTHGFVDS